VSKAATVRDFAPRDSAACRGLWAELTGRHRDLFGDSSIGGDDPGSGFGEYLAGDAHKRLWVAEHAGAVVGFAGLILYGHKGEVEPVVVTERLRGRGVGRSLVETALAQARAEGLDQVFVRPVARNADALAFFHELGFTALGHVDLLLDLRRPETYWRAGERLAGREFLV
jgi:N-acetylglutamate synthase-like GNAT family acetyltransferase